MLEHVAGGWAFRASREAAEACGRLFERPVERGLSPAALETLAIVAYLGPCTPPGDRAHPRRRGRLGRRGPGRARADRRGGPRGRRRRRHPLPHDAAVRARLRPRSLSELPRLDDVGPDGRHADPRAPRRRRRARGAAHRPSRNRPHPAPWVGMTSAPATRCERNSEAAHVSAAGVSKRPTDYGRVCPGRRIGPVADLVPSSRPSGDAPAPRDRPRDAATPRQRRRRALGPKTVAPHRPRRRSSSATGTGQT